jgi:dihydropteroate synthase
MNTIFSVQAAINDKLSQRFIALDPGGYFLIYLDRETQCICMDHYTNDIDDSGLAVDPDTGEPIACRGQVERQPDAQFRAKTAKELCIEIFEQSETGLVTKLDHAAYLGRELIRAEIALAQGQEYIQD